MEFTIRTATEKDYDDLAGLFEQLNLIHSSGRPDVFVTPHPTAQTLEYVRSILRDKDRVIYVAQAGKNIAGFVYATIAKSPPDIPVFVKRRYVYVDNICVNPEYRRSSAGRKLMEAVERWALKKGVNQVELNVWDFNKKALAFYDSIGYKPSQHMLYKKLKETG